MKKNIDIILSVIDNFGDIGFCTEILMGLESLSPAKFHYRIWTDQSEKVANFFAYNSSSLPEYSLALLSDFWTESLSEFCLVFFHAEIPDEKYFTRSSIILRLDYLSLDPEWLQYHESSHILSTPERRIIEIIPSPLDLWWGILPEPQIFLSRDEIAQKYALDPEKEWITLFLYPETLRKKIDFSDLSSDLEILLVGSSIEFDLPSSPYIHVLPFLSINHFHHILAYSRWSIVRGEVSWMNIVSLGKPFFWDMYKEIGGFPHIQSEQFLDFFGFSSDYRDLHNSLNQPTGWRVTLTEYEAVLFSPENEQLFWTSRQKNIIHEVKKYIDSFHFSL